MNTFARSVVKLRLLDGVKLLLSCSLMYELLGVDCELGPLCWGFGD